MKKLLCILLSMLILSALLCSCNGGNNSAALKEPPEIGFLTPVQFEGYKLGTIEKLVSQNEISEIIDSAELSSYNEVEEGLDAVRNNEIHGFVLPSLYASQALVKVEDLKKIPFGLYENEICAVSLDTFKHSVPMDAVITTLREEGTSQRIALAHSPFPNPVDPYSRPEDYKKVDGRKITIGISNAENYPYNYRSESGELIGINVDVAYEIAAGIFAELEIKEYAEEELLPALENGEVDVIMSEFFLKEGEIIPMNRVYSHPYHTSSAQIIVKAENAGVVPVGFAQ